MDYEIFVSTLKKKWRVSGAGTARFWQSFKN